VKENLKIVFNSYLRQKWITLRQTKTEVISDPFYTYHRMHFTSGTASFLWYISVIIRVANRYSLVVSRRQTLLFGYPARRPELKVETATHQVCVAAHNTAKTSSNADDTYSTVSYSTQSTACWFPQFVHCTLSLPQRRI